MRPDYAGGSLLNLVASIAEGSAPARAMSRSALPPSELRIAHNVVLFIVDGLGEHQLQAHLAGGQLDRAKRAAITSVFPPTTASAITTSYTGAAPVEHGLTGWHTYFSQAACVAAALPMKSRGSEVALGLRGVAAANIFPEPCFDALAAPTTVVTDRRIIDSAYNVHHCGGATRISYDTLDQLVAHTLAAVKSSSGRKLVYAYWPEYDAAAHRYGPSSAQAGGAPREVDAAFGTLRGQLAGTDTLLVATADHGFQATPPEAALSLDEVPELASLLRLPLCGEPRTAFCHVQPGREREFEQRVRDWLGDRAQVRPSIELLEEGWFGPGRAHPLIRERIGEVALLLKGQCTVKDRVAGEKRFVLHGNHGGTSEAEMIVPLVVAHC